MIGNGANMFFRVKGRQHLLRQLQRFVNVAGPNIHVFARLNRAHYDGIVLSSDASPAHLPDHITYVKPSYFGVKREYPVPQFRREHA